MDDINRFIINHMFCQNTGHTQCPGPFLQQFLNNDLFRIDIYLRKPIKLSVMHVNSMSLLTTLCVIESTVRIYCDHLVFGNKAKKENHVLP